MKIPHQQRLLGRPGIYLVLVVLVVAGIISAIGTGGGSIEWGSDVTYVSSPNVGWISITSPTTADSYSTDSSPQYISGEAFISPVKSTCCSGHVSDTGVTVTWHNEATGQTSEADQFVNYCVNLTEVYLCDHTWSINIPIAEGNNRISVTASDSGSSFATETITIERSTDITPPSVVATDPADGATDVHYTTSVIATFNESIEPVTINLNTFIVKSVSGEPASGIISLSDSGTQAIFKPWPYLAVDDNYQATLTTGITDLSGKPLSMDFVWSFVTGEGDTVAPTILSTTPQNGATDVSLNASIEVTFSEPMLSTTITTDTFLLFDTANNPVDGSVTPSGDNATFTSSSPLEQTSLYTAVVTTGITDNAGNALVNDYSWTFTTTTPDTTPPTVTNTSPSDNETGVAIESNLIVAFSEDMDITTINESTFILQDSNANAFSGNVDNGNTFRPYTNLALDETYTATITTGARDLAGNALAQAYSWSFTTTQDGIGSWSATSTINAPSPREEATAVWTGQEMIVWGGYDGSRLNTGARYNPASDSWQNISTANAPGGCSTPVSAWTGQEMIVWCGGIITGDKGGRYNPATDSWTSMSTLNAPAGVNETTAVWTGTEMIVWGGYGGTYSNSGGRYNPATDTWQLTTRTGAPAPRVYHTAVWSGSEMMIWGGDGGPYVNISDTGGGYDPATDSWRDIASSGFLYTKAGHVANWSGSEMIVWKGNTNSGRYNPATDSWNQIASLNALITRSSPLSEWTEDSMIVWGGSGFNSGGSYNPATNSWRLMTYSDAPSSHSDGVSVWTGSEFIVWGGRDRSGALTNTGGRYRYP